jgi:hypothetical protein
MMNQPLDNFFREKLEHAHKPAPATAWDRIDTGLEGRQRKGLWLRIAASILIVAAGSFILWPSQHDAGTQQVAKSKKSTVHGPQSTDSVIEENISQASPKQQDQEPAMMHAPASPAVAMNPTHPVKPQARKQQSATPVSIDKPRQAEPEQQPVAYQSYEAQQTITEPEHESVMPVQPVPAPANAVLADNNMEEATETDEAVTLVYSASEIDEKYLNKEALAKATSAQKKPSTFRKLLDKAYDLKNNQDPMGGLRQKKNEILALSFKSEKRSQNK